MLLLAVFGNWNLDMGQEHGLVVSRSRYIDMCVQDSARISTQIWIGSIQKLSIKLRSRQGQFGGLA